MSAYASPPSDAFMRSREVFESTVLELGGPEMAIKTHGELEEHLTAKAREMTRTLLQDHLDLRAIREVEHDEVVDVDEVERTRIEAGRTRKLLTVLGEVVVERLAYREDCESDLHPADATLNLPREKHSHGLRRLAAIESSRGSFSSAVDAIERTTGTRVGKRQVEELTRRAASDVDNFYATRKPRPSPKSDVVVLSADGKGVVMRPDALRESTAHAAATSENKLTTRLSRGEKRNRKRMAEVGAVYDITPAIRTPCDIITTDDSHERSPGPVARDKWLTASVERGISEVIGFVFDEADRRDPKHRRPWIALVDGNKQQIDCIKAQAQQRGLEVDILIDFVHVIEYLWTAAWCFFPEGDKAAESWVGTHALSILRGAWQSVAAAIRGKATANDLKPDERKGADTCAEYLTSKGAHLDYAKALASGWPIATGIIEGACRYLVKDRMDVTGARWGLEGAEATLKLRALISNGDFDDYWKFHLDCEQQRVHESRYFKGELPTQLATAA